MRKPREQKISEKCSLPFLGAQRINSLLPSEDSAKTLKCQTGEPGNHLHKESQTLTIFHLVCVQFFVCIAYYIYYVILVCHQYRLQAAWRSRSCSSVIRCCLHSYGNVPLQQQNWVFLQIGFEEAGKGKFPTLACGAGHGDGNGDGMGLSCPTAMRPASVLSPAQDFWPVGGEPGTWAELIFVCLGNYTSDVFFILSLRQLPSSNLSTCYAIQRQQLTDRVTELFHLPH